MASLRKRGKCWYFTITDADGRRRESKGCKDKRVTDQMAAVAELEIAKLKGGLTDPKSEARRRHSSRPLSEHLDDWRARLLSAGGTAKHADLSLDRARRVATLVMGKPLAEIDPPRTATKVDRDRAASVVTRTLVS